MEEPLEQVIPSPEPPLDLRETVHDHRTAWPVGMRPATVQLPVPDAASPPDEVDDMVVSVGDVDAFLQPQRVVSDWDEAFAWEDEDADPWEGD